MINKVIQYDSREHQHKNDHILIGFKQLGYSYICSKLFVGDYTLLHNQTICIDRKQSILECQQNLMNYEKHKAFRNECDRAYNNGIKLYILIEESGIKNIDDVSNYKIPTYKSNGYKKINGKSKLTHYKGQPIAKFDPKILSKVMKTFEEKHHCKFMFCDKNDTAKIIIFLLTNNTKGDK